MTIVLAVLGLAFTAFVVWLTVRIVNRRERWAKRVAISLVVAAVVYPLSIGPATWLNERELLPNAALSSIYLPLFWMYEHAPRSLQAAADWYIGVWSKKTNDGILFDPVESSAERSQ
jgi:hypothetical protein